MLRLDELGRKTPAITKFPADWSNIYVFGFLPFDRNEQSLNSWSLEEKGGDSNHVH